MGFSESRCVGQVVAATAALLGLVGIRLSAEPGMIVIGQEGKELLGKPAPDFVLTPLSGGAPLRLSTQRGKTVMLVFWQRHGHALPLVDQANRLFRRQGLVVWTINYEEDDPAALRQFVRQRGYTFPVLHDPGGRVSRNYVVSGNTTAVILDRSGKVVRFKHNFFGESDFWKMLTEVGFSRSKLKRSK